MAHAEGAHSFAASMRQEADEVAGDWPLLPLPRNLPLPSSDRACAGLADAAFDTAADVAAVASARVRDTVRNMPGKYVYGSGFGGSWPARVRSLISLKPATARRVNSAARVWTTVRHEHKNAHPRA
jgi:hypothetical protein